jgi:hypothetical protein
MQIPDINALLYAHRPDFPQHERYRAWLADVLNGVAGYGVVDIVTLGFLRIATNPRIFTQPTPLAHALRFVEVLCGRPQAVQVFPGPRHWAIFEQMCRRIGATGADTTDAYLAALAVEHGHELVTEDGGFKRFPELRTVRPKPQRSRRRS